MGWKYYFQSIKNIFPKTLLKMYRWNQLENFNRFNLIASLISAWFIVGACSDIGSTIHFWFYRLENKNVSRYRSQKKCFLVTQTILLNKQNSLHNETWTLIITAKKCLFTPILTLEYTILMYNFTPNWKPTALKSNSSWRCLEIEKNRVFKRVKRTLLSGPSKKQCKKLFVVCICTRIIAFISIEKELCIRVYKFHRIQFLFIFGG